MYKMILLASDGSDHALRATKEAIALANINDAKVIVAYVTDFDRPNSRDLDNSDSKEIELKRKKQLHSTEALLQEADLEYEVEILRGEPGPAIVQHANENPIDLVVIGSRGLNRMQEMVLGSVSHKVAKRADCPVLIVK